MTIRTFRAWDITTIFFWPHSMDGELVWQVPITFLLTSVAKWLWPLQHKVKIIVMCYIPYPTNNPHHENQRETLQKTWFILTHLFRGFIKTPQNKPGKSTCEKIMYHLTNSLYFQDFWFLLWYWFPYSYRYFYICGNLNDISLLLFWQWSHWPCAMLWGGL